MRPSPRDARRRALVGAMLMAVALTGCGGGDATPATVPEPGPPPAEPPPPPAPEPEPPGRRWFIDPEEGDDANAGTSRDAPRRTLPVLDDGDTVLLRRGTTLVTAGDYSPRAHQVTFDAYTPAGEPAGLPRPVWTVDGSGHFILWVINLDGLVMRNIAFRAAPGQTGRPAFRLSIQATPAQAPVFQSCEFTGDDGAFYADIGTDCRGLAFQGCSFSCARGVSWSYGRSAGVFILATSGRQPFEVHDMLWEDNDITNAHGLGMMIRSGSASDDDVTVFPGRFVDATFRRNRWHDCAKSGVFLVCGFHADMRIEAAGHYGWDGLLFEDNVVEDNLGPGASIGSNVRDTNRMTTIQRNRVTGNGRGEGTTGGLQLMALQHALVQDNECRDNWTVGGFDGVNLFMDIYDAATSEMSTAGAVGCVVRRNLCTGARGAGGASYASWVAEQHDNPNSSNAPSSGIRLYFARGNDVYANVLLDNGTGVACDKSVDNRIYNNTAIGCTMAWYDGVGLATRANRFFNNASLDCDWDLYGLGTAGWDLPRPTPAAVMLDGRTGSFVTLLGDGAFAIVRLGVGARNFSVRERDDPGFSKGLAVVSSKGSDGEIHVNVMRPFTATEFAAGDLLVGAMEPYVAGGIDFNARFGGRVGSVKELVAGAHDVLLPPLLDANGVPAAGSPLLGAGMPLPDPPLLVPHTDMRGRAFRAVPSIGAFEPER